MNWQNGGDTDPAPLPELGKWDVASPTPEEPARRRRPSRLVALAVPLALLAAGVAGSITLAQGGGSPATTPDSAVRALLDAAQHGDLLGALATLEPSERDALEAGITRTTSELRRLQVLSSDANLSNISGVSVAFSNVKTSTAYLTPAHDRAAVTITSGTATSHLDPSKLPLGSFTRSVAGQALAKAQAKTDSSSVSTGKGVIVAVQESGHWYVSLGYTVAENAVRSAGLATPATPVPAVGSATADDAIRRLVQSAANLDLTGVISTTPPDEMGALHAYAPLFLSKADQAVSKVKSKLSVSVTGLDLADQPDGAGATLVTVKDIAFHATYQQYTVDYANGCVTVTDSADPSNDQHICKADALAKTNGMLAALPPDVQTIVQDLKNAHPAEGLVAVQSGGQWYFDPVRTVFTDLDNLLSALSVKDMNAIESLVKQFSSGGLSSGGSGLFSHATLGSNAP